MTPVQIAYFKHFLFDCGVQAIYISMYKKNRIKGSPQGDKEGNPESLEQFLQECPYFHVIMRAFYFQTGSDFGYDYWYDINKKWLSYWKIHENNHQNSKVVIFKGSFGILRQNWDRQQYWKTETMEATYARMHMEPPLKDVDLETAFKLYSSAHEEEKHKFKAGDIIEGSISGEVLTVISVKKNCYKTNDGGIIDFDKEEYWEKIDEVPEDVQDVDFEEDAATDVKEKTDGSEESDNNLVLDGFSLVDTSNKHGGRRMKGVVSVNIRNGGYRVTFPSAESEKLRKHKYKYVQILTKKDTGEIAFRFNHNKGCIVGIKSTINSSTKNVVVNSKDVTDIILDFYKIPKSNDYFKLSIDSVTQINDDMIYIFKYNE